MNPIDFRLARWVSSKQIEEVKKVIDSRCMLVFDHLDRPLLLFANEFTLNYFMDRHSDIKLIEALDVSNNFGADEG